MSRHKYELFGHLIPLARANTEDFEDYELTSLTRRLTAAQQRVFCTI